jgi:glycosyltransferase involved in cell wall biosynthesis
VESCWAQTHSHFEIIITDNSTNNDTADMVAKWTDPRVRYYNNGGNIGATASANRALSLATGRHIHLLMDDDLIKPRFLELMVKALEEHPTAGIAMAPMDLLDENFQRIFPRFYVFQKMRYRFRYQVGDGLIERRRVLRDFLTGVRSRKPSEYPCTVPSGFLLRGEAFRRAGPSTEEADFAGDLALCMRVAAEWDFYYIDQVLSSWRYVPEGHTSRGHHTGLKISVFYSITRQCLAQEAVRQLFRDEWEKTVRDSLFFCSCRALLNVLAGLRARSPKLIFSALNTILREDKYMFNRVRLPVFVVREILVSLFPPQEPPPRE